MTDDEIAELHEKWWKTQNPRFDAMKYAISEDAFIAGFKAAFGVIGGRMELEL